MSTIKRVAASQYRMRNATVLGKPDGTSDINKQINQNRGATDFEFDNAGNDDDSSNDRKFAPDDPQTLIDMLRMEAAADDLLQRHNAKELAFHQATLKQLEIIMGRDAEATPQTPIAEDATRRSAFPLRPALTRVTLYYTSVADLYTRNKQLDPATACVQYFVTFRKISLQQQMRFTDDAKHIALIGKLRQPYPPMDDIIDEIERDYQVLPVTRFSLRVL